MEEQLRDVLKELKWTEYESTAYAALVDRGAMNPTDVIDYTDIPSGRIYDTLKSLEKRGAVIQIDDRPKLYDAQNPRIVLNTHFQSLEQKIANTLKNAEEAWEHRVQTINNNNEIHAWSVRGRRGISIQLRSFMESCKKSVLIVDRDISWIGRRDDKIIRNLIQNNVEVKIISSASFRENLEHLNSLQVETKWGDLSSDYYIIDDSLVMLKVGNPPSGVVIREETFLKKMIKDFNKDFKIGKKVIVDVF